MQNDTGKTFDISSFVTANGVPGDQNFKYECSIHDCRIMREKYGQDLFMRCWVSSEFLCTHCGRQLSIVDLFNSQTMTHSRDFIRSALADDRKKFEVIYGNPKRAVEVSCDCGHSDYYQVPEFAIMTSNRHVMAYTRSCQSCTSPD